MDRGCPCEVDGGRSRPDRERFGLPVRLRGRGADVTAVLPGRAKVVKANDADLREAVKHALDRSGCTFEQLAEQAKTGHFDTVRARMAWVTIADLKDLADR